MSPSRLLHLVAAAVLAAILAACAGEIVDPDAGPSVEPAPTDVTGTPSPSPEPTPRVAGMGVVIVDDEPVDVRGDCTVSRDFGGQAVEELDAAVEVVLAVSNLTSDGRHAGPFALQVRLGGTGDVVGRTLTSIGGRGDHGGDVPRYVGPVARAQLVDRESLASHDLATLSLEASQERVRGSSAAADDRRLVVEVACVISRPG